MWLQEEMYFSTSSIDSECLLLNHHGRIFVETFSVLLEREYALHLLASTLAPFFFEGVVEGKTFQCDVMGCQVLLSICQPAA